MSSLPNYVRTFCERSNAKSVATSIQQALTACDNAMQDDMLDALYHARDEGGAPAKVNHPSISILSVFFRHRRTSRMWGNTHYGSIRDFKNQTIIGHDLYTSSSHWGACSRTAAGSYRLNPGSPKVNTESLLRNAPVDELPEVISHAGFPLKPVLFTQPLFWRPYLRAGLSLQARSDSVYKLTTTLLSAIWGGITPSFLLSRTPTQSNMTSFGSPPTLGLDPPRPKLLKSMCAIESGLYMSDLVGADDAFSYPLYR